MKPPSDNLTNCNLLVDYEPMNMELGVQEQIYSSSHQILTSNFWHDNPDGTYYENFGYAQPYVGPLVSGLENVLVIPHATGFGETPQATKDVYEKWGAKNVNLLHEHSGDELSVIEQAPLIHITGGNYYTLVLNLHALRNPDGSLMDKRTGAVQTPIVEALRQKIAEGTPFVGISAGLLAAAEDGRYADDPIKDFHYQSDGSVRVDGLNLISPHIRFMPHLTDERVPGIINRIITEDPSKIVLGVNNYSLLQINGREAHIGGTAETVLFEYGKAPQALQPGDNISHLLLPRTLEA